MKQREIYLAHLDPIKGREQAGLRPVVIVSGETMTQNFDVVIACPLSSQVKGYPACVLLKKSALNGLSCDSEILPFQIRTLSKLRLKKKLGEITEKQLEELIEALNDVLRY